MEQSIAALARRHVRSLERIEERIGHRFKDRLLLQRALVHSSYAFERLGGKGNNETLEFLGDAVLDLAVGYILLTRFPDMREGKLTKLRAALVNESGLAERAREIGLGEFLLLGRGEAASGGREKPSILSCAYEALVGALFLDAGYDRALEFVRRFFSPLIEGDERDMLLLADAKSGLQERLQERFNEAPAYVMERAEGPAHARTFTVSVRFRGTELGRGRASSKKEAEQQAAAEALRHWQDLDLE